MSNPNAAAETPSVLSAVGTPASTSNGSTDGAITDGGSGGHTSRGSKSETDPDLRCAGEHERTNHDNASLSYEYGPELLERNGAFRGLIGSFKPLRSCVELGTSPSEDMKSTYDRAHANLQEVTRKNRPCNSGWVPPGGMEDTWSRWADGTTHAPTSELYEEAKSQYGGKIYKDFWEMSAWAESRGTTLDKLTNAL
ncbi:hypothetical protein V865_008070 [Kwoniella europaea PYCC6329]|uniref:Uncharacterized protein n=1 Tax=Kwoniella europaea PYCC6329 TaxID=1423913 RepID=A0AAX4KWH8_9TREE